MNPGSLHANMCKVVLDANIFISFLISHNPPISTILDLWIRGGIAVCYSVEILNELEGALKYPKIRKLVSDLELESLINAIKTLGILVISTKKAEICRDKKDDKYIEVCWESGSKFLVSGDEDLLSLGEFRGIKIVNPHDFVNEMIDD